MIWYRLDEKQPPAGVHVLICNSQRTFVGPAKMGRGPNGAGIRWQMGGFAKSTQDWPWWAEMEFPQEPVK